MQSCVLWSLLRACFFVGLGIFITVFASEIMDRIDRIAKYKAMIESINIFNGHAKESDWTVTLTLYSIFAAIWAVFSLIIGGHRMDSIKFEIAKNKQIDEQNSDREKCVACGRGNPTL